MHATVSAMANTDHHAFVEPAERRSIVTRFGEIDIDDDKIITFDAGLYGLEQHRHFMLSSVQDWPEPFKLLQSVEDPRLSLIVMPLESAGGLVDPLDFVEACRVLGFDENAVTMLGIVTMRAGGGNQTFTVNLKAPLFIDTERRRGRQHVFASEAYHLRHPIPTADGEEA